MMQSAWQARLRTAIAGSVGGLILIMAACSGGLTGGATPPVTPQAATASYGGSAPSNPGAPGAPIPTGSAVPAPSVTSEISVTASATPFPLPTTGGYSGTLAVTAALPQASEEPIIDVKVIPQPSTAPVRPDPGKSRVTKPLLEIDLDPVGGDTIITGLSALNLIAPAPAVQAAHHVMIGLFENSITGSEHALFRHKHSAAPTLLDFDSEAKFTKTSHILSLHHDAVTLRDSHHYAVVYYVDRLAALPTVAPAIPTPASSLSPNASALTSPGASSTAPAATLTPGAIGTSGTTPFPAGVISTPSAAVSPAVSVSATP